MSASRSVAAFLADNPPNRRGSMLDPFETELRELAKAGASLRQLIKYLWLNHQIKPSSSSFSLWLIRRGIGSSGRTVPQPAPRASASQEAVAAPRRRPMPQGLPAPLFGKATPMTAPAPGYVPGSTRFEAPGMPLSAKPASNADLDAVVAAAMGRANQHTLTNRAKRE